MHISIYFKPRCRDYAITCKKAYTREVGFLICNSQVSHSWARINFTSNQKWRWNLLMEETIQTESRLNFLSRLGRISFLLQSSSKRAPVISNLLHIYFDCSLLKNNSCNDFDWSVFSKRKITLKIAGKISKKTATSSFFYNGANHS